MAEIANIIKWDNVSSGIPRMIIIIFKIKGRKNNINNSIMVMTIIIKIIITMIKIMKTMNMIMIIIIIKVRKKGLE